jgi:hypothetical protein
MYCERRPLFHGLDRHKPHVRTAHGFADCLGIPRIVLVRLDVRLEELGRNQFDRMPERAKLPRLMMRTVTGLNPDQARQKTSRLRLASAAE